MFGGANEKSVDREPWVTNQVGNLHDFPPVVEACNNHSFVHIGHLLAGRFGIVFFLEWHVFAFWNA